MKKFFRFVYFFFSFSLAFHILLNIPEWNKFLALALGYAFAGLRYDLNELQENKNDSRSS